QNLRSLDGITSAPLLHADGSIRAVEGYDPETRLWCEQVPTIEVSDAPTESDARAALARVRFWLRTFAFADAKRVNVPDVAVPVVDLSLPPGADESAYLVALLTAVCRSSLWLAPAVLVRGPQISGAGTGKGLMARAMSIIAFGSQPRAMTAGTRGEETEKRIAAVLISGDPVLFLDNVNGVLLKSDTLASVITERPATVRPLGGSKIVPLNSAALVVVTGNGLTLSEDMVRRFIVVELDAGVEDPETREFRGDLLEDIAIARSDLLQDLLTIWRWGRQQGDALPSGKPLGSFHQWARWCRDPMVALGCVDPIARISTAKAADPRRAFLAEVFSTWARCHSDAQVPVKDLAPPVTMLLDPTSKGRQYLAAQVRGMAGTRAGGYQLTHTPSAGKWSGDLYRLVPTTGKT
ncbi:MAG: hypothetical protein Q7U75_05570, partial [Desulfobacterales bacterium]|nr:hypothetical protein [Desulfobacterales bacterium]